MRRFERIAAVLALAVLAAINVRVQAHSAADADGSFAAGLVQPSTLGATNTGLRVLDGLIAVQIHASGPMEVQFKDIQIRVLP
ncbi:MAG: hypothetical protein WA746_18375 [Isosphaeraceae bacterium]